MYVYILTNPGKTVFYTGVTNNLKRRLREHRDGKGKAKNFTGKYYCYKLVYFEYFTEPRKAIEREKEIKKLSRSNKIKLIKEKNPSMVSYRL